MDSTPNEQSLSYQFVPFYYSNQLQISNDLVTPNTKLDIGVGTILDSTATFQLTNAAPIVIDATQNGLNGLDTGTLAASTVYSIYLVADPVTLQKTGAMISLSYSTPLLPFGYSAFSLIGYVTTDASSYFLKGYWTVGNGSQHLFMYDAPQVTAVTAGASGTYANVNLIHVVPNVANLPVYVYTSFAAGAPGDTASLQPGNATGAAVTITSQVVTVPVTSTSLVLAQPVSLTGVISPVINYKVSGTDTLAVDVAGYAYYI